MAELAAETRDMNFQLEQVQDFTPTPMTVSTETWYSGYHPYTLEPVYSAHTPQEKLKQRMFFFWYKPEERQRIISELRKIGRPDLIARLYPQNVSYNANQERKEGYVMSRQKRSNYTQRNVPANKRKPKNKTTSKSNRK